MAKLKMLLKANTTTLSFNTLTANDNISIVDTDTSYEISLTGNTINITTPPQLISI